MSRLRFEGKSAIVTGAGRGMGRAVAPGSMDTEMVRELSTPEHREQERKAIPLRRLGTVQDEANLVAFLCSEETSYIAGATVDINGADLLL